MIKFIPFGVFPVKTLLALTSPLNKIGRLVSSVFPYLDLELEQAEIKATAVEYSSILAFLFFFYLIIFSAVFYLIGQRFVDDQTQAILLALTFGSIFSFMILIQVSLYPKIIIKKKVRDIEGNLVYMLRTMLVQMRSGISLFDSMSLIAKSDFGRLSEEFGKTVTLINAGVGEEYALHKLATRNPSPYFRRTLWQIINGLKAGIDISQIVSVTVEDLTRVQLNQIRKYGSKLSFLSLVYMLIGVIVPALAVTFLIILTSFPQINIPEFMFWIILGIVIVGQIMYLGLMKAQRPYLMER